MAILLDNRYVLLTERQSGWLERAYDGWDTVENRPVTVGWFAQSEPLPVLPATIGLRHPAILGLLDLRVEPGAGTWVIWEHFGEAGAEALSEIAISHRAAAWILHETVGALAYAREALGRPGGFRMADFRPEMIRLYPDGSVRVAGFGRIAAETSTADEFGRLGAWAGEWLAHSHDAATDAHANATVAGDLVETLGRLQQADVQPQAAVPRITTGLRAHMDGGLEELGAWVSKTGSEAGASSLNESYQKYLHHPNEVHPISTVSPASVDAEREALDLPRVRIAPILREPDPAAARTRKGLPVQSRRHMPMLLVGIAILLIAFGSLAFRPWSDSTEEAQSHQVWLETVPAGASVFVDDTLRMGKTPLALDGLRTGWHRVRFEKAEFTGLEDSILIYKSGAHRPFKFVFARPLRVESNPPGAIAYLNGRRAERPTPCVEGAWPATQSISLVMHLEQYGSLEDCQLDPMYGTLEVKDPAAWRVTRAGDTLVVSGLFVSTVSFFASPPDCALRVDDTLEADPTGALSYPLTYGMHRLQAEAVGFDPLDTMIVVSGRTQKLLPVVLSRPVRIFAYDPSDKDNDLRVLVDRLEGPERSLLVRRFTPYSVRVPAVAHTITLSKRNYLDTTVYIPPDVTKVEVAMRASGSASRTPAHAGRVEQQPDRVEQQPGRVEQHATPGESAPPVPASRAGAPWITVAISCPGRTHLGGAEVWMRTAGEVAEEWLGTTDEKGELRVQIPDGNYDLLAYLDAFSGIRKRVKVRDDRNRPILIELRR